MVYRAKRRKKEKSSVYGTINVFHMCMMCTVLFCAFCHLVYWALRPVSGTLWYLMLKGCFLIGWVDLTARKLRRRNRRQQLLVTPIQQWNLEQDPEQPEQKREPLRLHLLRLLRLLQRAAHPLHRRRQWRLHRCHRSVNLSHGQPTKWQLPSCGALRSPTLSLWMASIVSHYYTGVSGVSDVVIIDGNSAPDITILVEYLPCLIYFYVFVIVKTQFVAFLRPVSCGSAIPLQLQVLGTPEHGTEQWPYNFLHMTIPLHNISVTFLICPSSMEPTFYVKTDMS